MGDGDDIIIMGVIRRWTWLVTEFSVQTCVSWFSTIKHPKCAMEMLQ